jgi:hypothetical protein
MEDRMRQSQQDDIFDNLQLFAEKTYIYLTLCAKQRRLNQDELYILEQASKALYFSAKVA